MTLTPRQYEVLRWMRDSGGVAISLISGLWYRHLRIITDKRTLTNIHGMTLNSLLDSQFIKYHKLLGYGIRLYKISKVGLRALREYEEKGKKNA